MSEATELLLRNVQQFISLVPEYDLSEPYQSNEDGEFVSHTLHERRTRDVTGHDKGAWHYRMKAFGKKMHLKLRRNTQLVKPGLVLERRHENGDVTWTPLKTGSYFHGKEALDPGSLVAVSNDKGLVSCRLFYFILEGHRCDISQNDKKPF